MIFHQSECLLHLPQNSNRISDQIGRPITLQPRYQRSLALNP
jgi:hypothetical protein